MKQLYCISDYWTDDIIDVVDSFEKALAIARAHEGAIIQPDDSDEILFENVDLPF